MTQGKRAFLTQIQRELDAEWREERAVGNSVCPAQARDAFMRLSSGLT